MLNHIDIRIATPADAPMIADLSRRTFYDSFAADNTSENMELFLSTQFTREKLIAELNEPGNIFLTAWLGGVLAGYCRLQDNTAPPELEGDSAIEIVRIYSEKFAIGQGVGKALMQECLAIARNKQKDWIWLGVWEHNQRALAFYSKWGFERFGEHIFMVGNDPQTDWYMRRRP